MFLPRAADSALSRATAHLDAAIHLALDHANADPDPLMSAWANTARGIDIAAGGLRLHVHGLVEPASHSHCRAALWAAAGEIGQLRPGVDVPLVDLVFVMEYLAPALKHAQGEHDGHPDADTPGRPSPSEPPSRPAPAEGPSPA